MTPNTDQECEELPHIILTSGDTWDPKVLDNMLTDKDDWRNTLKDLDERIIKPPFDQFGNYLNRSVVPEVQVLPPVNQPTEADLHELCK